MKKKRFVELIKKGFKLPLLEKLLATASQGKRPDQFFARLPPLYTAYKPNSIRRVSRGQIHYELDISDYMEWLIFYGIIVEPREQFYQMLNFGDIVVDVGANVGETTLNMAKAVGFKGQVHSFEPDPMIFDKLSRNVAINSFHNITLNNIGIGDSEIEVTIAAEVENNRGGTRVQPRATMGKKVNIDTLDNYFNKKDLQKVRLIKVDVEGYEMKVILGGRNTISKFKPILFIEINNNNLKAQGDSAKGLMFLLRELGYHEIRNAGTNELLTPDHNFEDVHLDIIAKPVNG